MNTKRTRYSCAPPRLMRLLRISVSFVLLSMLTKAPAQDFIVNGTVNNTGSIRVKKQTVIAQPAVGGEIVLSGADQLLPAKQYQNVRLIGTGTKTTSGGNLSVQKNLTIAAPVTLNITKGTILTLGDTLFESGILKGAIQRTVNLPNTSSASDFGNIGAAIDSLSVAPGSTNVIRVSDSLQFGNGNQSIKRYYQIQPTDASATGKITFKYSDTELNGHDIKTLQLWRSSDNGVTWIRFTPVVDTLLKTISKTNVPLDGRWTMSDTLRPIGPLNGAAGVPAIMANNSVPNIKPAIMSVLNPYQVRVADIFDAPLSNVKVYFTITSKPASTSGEDLSNDSALTNASGIAATTLTLGTKVGAYVVTATSGSLTPVFFRDTANHGPAQSLAALFSAQMQPILTQLDSAFTITVKDAGDNPVGGAQVTFSLFNVPSGSFGHSLSATNVLTDSLGRASTFLTLGSKPDTFKVKAKVTGLADSAIFAAKANVGAAAEIRKGAGDNQTGTVGSSTNPLEALLVDLGENPVAGDVISFRIASVPNGADSGSLSSTTVPTNSLGQASTILTLGTKPGNYIVSAENQTSGGSLTFTVNAKSGAAQSLALLQGNGQSATVNQSLAADFVVKLTDAFGNGVADSTITFSIDSIPNGVTTNPSLSVVSVTTDSSGRASTRLTLGNKTGKYVVNAKSNGVSIVSFSANASAGAAAAIASVNGNNQSARIITPLANQFALRVIDVGGNDVPGVIVNFAFDSIPANATGHQLSDSTAISGSDGFVRTILTLGNKVGQYRVKATASGLPATIFAATATQGAAASFALATGNQQINPTGTMLDTAFVVRVQDIGGNDLVNSDVHFAFDTIPQFATGYALRDTVVKTDSSGMASTVLTLGNREGSYSVKATVEGILSTRFTANAYYIYGDPNNDIDVNIADITMIIDQINNKIALTDVDSIKSDLNRDGNVDTSDVTLLRNSILDRPIFSNSLPPFIPVGDQGGRGAFAPTAANAKSFFQGAKTRFEATPQGLRLNMENTVAVRGLEVRLRLKDSTINVENINYLFSRAQSMSIIMRSVNNEIRMLAYSLINSEIEPGDGTLLRIPKITSLAQIDTMHVILSVAGNTAVTPEAIAVSAPPGKYPLTFRLDQNYPNPFNGATTIQYEIPDNKTTETKVAIHIFNVLGQKVKTLVTGPQDPGIYSVKWNGTDDSGLQVSTGVYFYRLITKTHVTTKKMIYVK